MIDKIIVEKIKTVMNVCLLLTIITRTFESLICTELNDINSFLWIPVERLRVDDNGGRKIFEKTFKNAKIKFTDNIRNKEKTHSHRVKHPPCDKSYISHSPAIFVRDFSFRC